MSTTKKTKTQLKKALQEHPGFKVATKLRCFSDFFDYCGKDTPELVAELPEQERVEVEGILQVLAAYREYAVGLKVWSMEQVGFEMPTRQLELTNFQIEETIEMKQHLGGWYESLPSKKTTRKKQGVHS